jgi:hypothetical protein
VKRARDPLFVVGLTVTAVVHLGVFGGVWLTRARASQDKPVGPGTFVDAQLVKFGKPRDLSFLPHKEGSMKRTGPPVGLKVATSADAKPSNEKQEKPPDVVDPLKKTHAELFKQLNDDRPAAVTEEGGSLTGSRSGTALEAKGDPYILSLIDQIGSAWTVPTTLTPGQLRELKADVCLTIDASGALTRYVFERRSGNGQFDSSLDAALGTIKQLPAPPDRFREHAARGRLCATLYPPEK